MNFAALREGCTGCTGCTSVCVITKNRLDPKRKLPVKIEKYVSRACGLNADRADGVHPCTPVHP